MSGALVKFIEIRDGLSVCIDEIEAIQKNENGMTCSVFVGTNTFQSTFPYSVLLSLLERQTEEEPKEKEELNIFKTLGTFAG